MKMNITIERLERPLYCGDWHDKPLKWQVSGPDSEVQKFSTKKEAKLFRSIRRRSGTFQEASRRYAATY